MNTYLGFTFCVKNQRANLRHEISNTRLARSQALYNRKGYCVEARLLVQYTIESTVLILLTSSKFSQRQLDMKTFSRRDLGQLKKGEMV